MQEEAEENSITTSQLLGYLLHRENYVKDRALAAVGMQVFSKAKNLAWMKVSIFSHNINLVVLVTQV